MAYKVIDIYKDLPKIMGCRDCGRPGCFAFATSVHLEGMSLTKCIHLAGEQLEIMQGKVAENRVHSSGIQETPEAQAARLLQQTFKSADLTVLARRSATFLVESPSEAIEVEFLSRTFHLRPDEVVALDGEDVAVWIKVVLLMYVTRATGSEPSGKWVAYRDLPNTISKQMTYEKWVDRIPQVFSGRFGELERRARELGALKVEHDSADLAFQWQALPRVPLLLLLWDEDGDFAARGSLLLDQTVLDYLDQEALTFLAEELMRRMIE